MHSFDAYKQRPLEFIEQADTNGWSVKIYGISAQSLPLAAELVTGARQLLSQLPQPASTTSRYGVGFLIIHQGAMRNWFLLDWWEDQDILHHLLFSSPLDKPTAITAEPDKSLFACVHELKVINFESQAWTETVLCEGGESGFEKYMKMTKS
ncbi:MAG: hypothetical protein MJK13_01055 [Pseudomonadales bacterium]|nr:hypothetical protein [Pseudomonadales bacterium]MCJ8338744.1 hypothetical protein [Pseudomonadales bacterium]NRA16125.1 hypothetical protein [Oceanospirillaceae bacterium]